MDEKDGKSSLYVVRSPRSRKKESMKKVAKPVVPVGVAAAQ